MKKEFLTGLTAVVLSIGLMLAGCESPTNGSNGGNGTNALPAATATTAAGAEKFFAEGHGVVYFAGALVLGDGGEDSLTIPDGRTLILADVADLQGRAVASDGKGSITVKAGGALNVGTTSAATLVVGGGSKIVVNDGTVAVPGASALVFAKGAVLQQTGGTLAAANATFAFEDPDDLSDNALAAVTGSGADSLNIGGTLDVATGEVSGGTTSAPADTVLVPATPAWPLVLTGKTLVIATGKTVASTSGGTTLKPGTYKFTNTSSLTADGVLTIGNSLEGTPDIEVADQAKLTQAAAAKLKAGTVTYTGATAFSGAFTPAPSGVLTYVFQTSLATGTNALGPDGKTFTFSANTTLPAGTTLAVDTDATLTLGTGTTALGANTITLAGATTTLNIPGTLTVTQGGSMWAAFPTGTGKVVVTGSIEQGGATWGIGTDREFVLGTGGSITYDVATPAVSVAGPVTAYAKGTDNALEWTKPHTVASGTLTIGDNAALKAGSTLTVDTGATLLVPAEKVLTNNGTVIFAANSTITGAGDVNVGGTGIVWNKNTGAGGTSIYGAGFTGKLKLVDGSKLYIGIKDSEGKFTDTGVTGAEHYWLGTATNTPDTVGTGALVDLDSAAYVEISHGKLAFYGAITTRDFRVSSGETLHVHGALTVYKQLSLPAGSALTVESTGSVKGVTTGNSYITSGGTWNTGTVSTITGLKADGTYEAGNTNISDAAAATNVGVMYKWKVAQSANVWLKLSNGND